MTPLVHKHVIVRAEVVNPPVDEKIATNSITDLIERIGMKILMGPYAKYCTMVGNRGLTVATIIETSHGNAYLGRVFTCDDTVGRLHLRSIQSTNGV